MKAAMCIECAFNQVLSACVNGSNNYIDGRQEIKVVVSSMVQSGKT